VRRFAAALLLAVVVFGLGQGGALRAPGVRPAVVAHACAYDGCVVEAGAFVTCMNNTACTNMVITVAVALLAYAVFPNQSNQAIANGLVGAYNAAGVGTKFAVDSLAGTINRAFSQGAVSVSPSAMEKAGLANLAVAIAAGQNMALVEPAPISTFGYAGMYQWADNTGTIGLVWTRIIPTCTSGDGCPGGNLAVGMDMSFYGTTYRNWVLSWKVLTPGGTILAAGATAPGAMSANGCCLGLWSTSGVDHQGKVLLGGYSGYVGDVLTVQLTPDVTRPQGDKWGVMAMGFGTNVYGAAPRFDDVGKQASYPLGTFYVNSAPGYFDSIGGAMTATPDPPSLPQSIGDQQIAIGAGIATVGYIGSLFGKTANQGVGAVGDSLIAAGSATPTITDAGGSTVPIVQPTVGTQTGVQLGLGTANGILTGIEAGIGSMATGITSIVTGTTTLTGVATGILTGVTAIITSIGSFFGWLTTTLTTFFDLSIPINWDRLRGSGGVLDRFPFSIPFDVIAIAGSVFSVAPVAPSFTGNIHSGIMGQTWSATMHLDAFSGIMAAFRWGELAALIIGVALAYRKWAGGAV
jgi:hypothetical protein